MTSEEQRVATRDEIMEDGSIFDFAKPLGANNASKRENINNKEKIIENFKKVTRQNLIDYLYPYTVFA